MRTAFTTVTATLAVIALSAAGAAAAMATNTTSATTTAATTPRGATTGHIIRFNEGATHSPRVERGLTARAIAPSAAQARPAAPTSAASSASSASSAVEGIDASSQQHPNGAAVDWTKVAAAQYKFAFIKVTEGSFYVNPYYAADAGGAKAAGMFEAPYAFAIPNYSGGAYQADYALDHANYAADGRTLPLILDIEYDPYASPPPNGDGTNECYGLTAPQMVSWIGAFVTETVGRTGAPPVIYTTQDWWDNCTGDSAAFAGDPLWIVTVGSAPALPSAWNDWSYWQYTSAATPPGFPAGVTTDASWLAADALEFAAPGDQSDQAGSTINRQFNAFDGGGAVTFSATGLPSGVQIDTSTGGLSGQLPTSGTTFPISVRASAAGDPSVTQNFAWHAHGKVTFGRLPGLGGSVGAPVWHQLPVADGLPGCTLRVTATGLPAGLAMNSCGLVTGWPTRSGAHTVRVAVTDSSGATLATRSFVWTIGSANGRGPAGHLRLSRDGKCLAALSSTNIAIEPCGAATNQQWTIAADGTVRINGRCLSAGKVASSASAALGLAPCGGKQRWQLRSNAVLVNLTNGRCLADSGARNGTRAVAATCQATANNTGSTSKPSPSQQWTLPAGPLPSGIAGWCASDQRVTGQRFGAVTLRPCNGTGAQAVTIAPSGTITIAGKCATLNGDAITPGTRVRLAPCDGSAYQVWQLTGGPMGVQVMSPVAGLCFADPGDRAVSGTQLVVGPCVAADPGTAWRVS
jgi:GH25 family lysozyme M1 (1,4-beta-N-acetylmuramidase)